MFPAPCSEFPNDNPLLHEGAIFRIEDVCGVAIAEAVVAREEEIAEKIAVIEASSITEETPRVELDAVVEAPRIEIEANAARIEIDDEVAAVIESPSIAIVEAAVDAEREAVSRPSGIYLSSDDEDDEIVITPIDPLEDAETFAAPREVSAELAPPAREVSAEIPPPPMNDEMKGDPFSSLVAVMVATLSRVSDENATALSALVLHGEVAPALSDGARNALVGGRILDSENHVQSAFNSTRIAWRALLNGESEEFPGSLPLDEWAADIVARALGTPSRASEFRRDLRSRGVAAFGLVDVAA